MGNYSTYELSAQLNRPVECYFWTIGTSTWAMCGQSDPYTVDGTTFLPTAISHGNIQVGSETRRQVLSVELPASTTLAQAYADNVPAQVATLSIYRLQNLDSTQTIEQIFFGNVKSVAFQDKTGMAQFGVYPITMNLERQAPRYVYCANCNLVLYDQGCRVQSTSYTYTGTVSAVNGNLVTVPGLTSTMGAGWANAGMILVNNVPRLVVGSSTDTLQILLPYNVSPLGSTVLVLAGCDHSLNTCVAKFNNAVNFLGFPYIPTFNPFASGLEDNL